MDASNLWLDAKSVLFYKAINKTKLFIDFIPEIMVMVKYNALVNGINTIRFRQ
jgi:hypothetical protein